MIGNFSNTVLSQAFGHTLRSFLVEPPACSLRRDAELGDDSLSIRATGSGRQRASANILLNKRYAWRGYQTSGLPDAHSATTSRWWPASTARWSAP